MDQRRGNVQVFIRCYVKNSRKLPRIEIFYSSSWVKLAKRFWGEVLVMCRAGASIASVQRGLFPMFSSSIPIKPRWVALDLAGLSSCFNSKCAAGCLNQLVEWLSVSRISVTGQKAKRFSFERAEGVCCGSGQDCVRGNLHRFSPRALIYTTISFKSLWKRTGRFPQELKTTVSKNVTLWKYKGWLFSET